MAVFIDVFDYIPEGANWSMHIGGRRCGKTYSAMSGIAKRLIGTSCKFIYMRRTVDECTISTTNDISDWTVINRDFNYNINFKNERKVTYIYNDNDLIGYASALSTLRNMRGINFANVDYILFDEFIPEAHAKIMAHEDWAVYSAYETINGARELLGKPPVKMIMLANMFNINTPLFASLGITDIVYQMLSKNTTNTYYDKGKGLSVTVYSEDDFKRAKSQTAIAKLTVNTGYDDISINNTLDIVDVKRLSLKPYQLLISQSDLNISIWVHKANKSLYVTQYYKCHNMPTERFFILSIGHMIDVASQNNAITYATAQCKITLAKIFPKFINI